jgi:hypothetical protein
MTGAGLVRVVSRATVLARESSCWARRDHPNPEALFAQPASTFHHP